MVRTLIQTNDQTELYRSIASSAIGIGGPDHLGLPSAASKFRNVLLLFFTFRSFFSKGEDKGRNCYFFGHRLATNPRSSSLQAEGKSQGLSPGTFFAYGLPFDGPQKEGWVHMAPRWPTRSTIDEPSLLCPAAHVAAIRPGSAVQKRVVDGNWWGGGLLLFHLHLHLQLLLLLLLLNDGRGLHFPRSSPSSGRKNNPSVKCDPSLGVIFRGPQQHAPQIFHVPSLTESISIQSRISYHFFFIKERTISVWNRVMTRSDHSKSE